MVTFHLLLMHVLSLVLPRTYSFALAEDLELEARMLPCDLIKYFGYPCDITYATTEDGYILEVYRIAHGIQEGFLFADNGFDVWAMSVRENKPYVRHRTLSQDEHEFWQFSFDEIGRYDVAAAIDHVLNATGARKLTVLGFSQGTLTNFILQSTRPEYSEKVSLFIGYGPVGNITHIKPPVKLVMPYVPTLMKLVYPFTQAGFLGSTHGLRELFTAACTFLGSIPCDIGFVLTGTSSPEQLNKTRIPVYLGHFPIGTSVQNFLHFYQIYKAKNLVMYDHGEAENRRRYGQVTPPPYPLERIQIPIALFSGQGDILADTADVSDLAYRLGTNLVFHRVVPQPSFSHQDFVNGNRANDFLHNTAIELAKKYLSQNP